MVGVGHGLDDGVPRVLPRIGVDVHQDPHQFGDAERRVRVVDMNGDAVREPGKRAVGRVIVAENTLQRRRNEEVLLRQTKQFSLVVVVGRIELLRDLLGAAGLFKRFDVGPLRREAEGRHRRLLRFPEPERVDGVGGRAGDHQIVGDGAHFVVFGVRDLELSVFPTLADLPAETDRHTLFGTRDQPRAAVFDPLIGNLDLFSVDEFLTEKPVLVEQRIPRRRIVERRKRIHKAGGKPTEPTVSEPRVGLAGENRGEIASVVEQHFVKRLADAEVVHVFFKRTPDEKLHTEIADFFAFRRFDPLFEVGAILVHHVLDDGDDGAIQLLVGRLLGRADPARKQFRVDQFSERFGFDPILFFVFLRLLLYGLCLCHCDFLSSEKLREIKVPGRVSGISRRNDPRRSRSSSLRRSVCPTRRDCGRAKGRP